MLHGILEQDHVQWNPLLIRHYTNSFFFYRTGPFEQVFKIFLPNCEMFLWTNAIGAACQQKTPTTHDTLSCHIWNYYSISRSSALIPLLISEDINKNWDKTDTSDQFGTCICCWDQSLLNLSCSGLWISTIPRYFCPALYSQSQYRQILSHGTKDNALD